MEVVTHVGVDSRYPSLDDAAVTVIGAGVAGLTSALSLQEAGANVRLQADTKPGDPDWNDHYAVPTTASEAAGASWKPFHLDFPDDHIRDHILATSWNWYQQRIDEDFPGVYKQRHIEASDLGPIDEEAKAYYLDIIGSYGRWPLKSTDSAPATSPIPGNHPFAIWYNTIHFDVSTFLPALAQRFEANGGVFEKLDEPFTDVAEATNQGGDAVILCVGLGARALLGDTSVHPVTGETLVVKGQVEFSPGELPYSMSVQTSRTDDEAHFANQYFYHHPGSDTTVVGGTAYPGHLDHVRPEAEIYMREGLARNLGERLHTQNEVIPRAGIRPERAGGVRVEIDEESTLQSGIVVALNYGHGGAGYTTAYGTADLVTSLVADKLS